MKNYIIVTKNSNKFNANLLYNKKRFQCKVGYGGISRKTREGDNITPTGIFRLISVFYRKDKIKRIITHLPTCKITRDMGWSDDSDDPFYNKLVSIPRHRTYETLYRNDDMYDLVIVTDFNINPTIPFKGSAIFIHCHGNTNTPFTRGCISLRKTDLISILPKLNKNSRLMIR